MISKAITMHIANPYIDQGVLLWESVAPFLWSFNVVKSDKHEKTGLETVQNGLKK